MRLLYVEAEIPFAVLFVVDGVCELFAVSERLSENELAPAAVQGNVFF